MTPGSVGVCRGVSLLALLFVSFTVRAEVIGHGLTNTALGNAVLYPQGYGYSVDNLGSNGLDGVSVLLGEPEGGVFLEPYVPGLSDGHFMYANAYGRLNQTNDTLLASIWGGRASDVVYPLNLDFSALAPESLTYQIFSGTNLQREFSRGQPMVVVQLYNYYHPVVNPLQRRPDGTLGASIALNGYAAFVFPEFLTSAYGDQLFIRVNNPGRQPGLVSRVDVFGGGGMSGFWFESIKLGAFHRPHRSLAGATLHAAPGSLRLGNLGNSNESPGVVIDLERVGSLKLEFEPFQISASNSVVSVTAVGQANTYTSESLGTLNFSRPEAQVMIDYTHIAGLDLQVWVLTNGAVVHTESTDTGLANAIVDGGTLVNAITAQAKTVENLPGYHVKFSQPTPITVASNGLSYWGDEVRFVAAGPRRIAHLDTLWLGVSHLDSITITNEIVTPPPGPPALSIARSGDELMLRWPDPNRLYSLLETYFYSPSYYYFTFANVTEEFTDPYVTAVVPLVKTNQVHFFRLLYHPD